jgi:hypothetical protein
MGWPAYPAKLNLKRAKLKNCKLLDRSPTTIDMPAPAASYPIAGVFYFIAHPQVTFERNDFLITVK